MLRSLRLFSILACLMITGLGAQAQLILVKQSTVYTFTLPDIIDNGGGGGTAHISGLTGQAGTVYLTRVTGTSGAITKAASTNNISEADAVNAPGQYMLALTATETGALGYIKGYYKSANSDPVSFTIKIVAYDPDSATNLGLSALPTASPAANGGLPTVNGSNQVAGVSGNVVGSVGSVTGAVGSVTGAVGSVTGSVGSVTGAVGSVTGNVGGSVASVTGAVGSVTGNVGGIAGITIPTTIPSLAQIQAGLPSDATVATDVWNAATRSLTDKSGFALTQAFPTRFSSLSIDASGLVGLQAGEHTNISADVLNASAGTYNGANTIGAKINAAGNAGDPWVTPLPGAYGIGTAGYIVGTNVNATISSRLATTAIPTNFGTLVIDGSGRVTLTPDEHILFPGDILGATAASYNSANTIGARINSAGAQGDPLANPVPGTYATGSAGAALGKFTFTGGNVNSIVQTYGTGLSPKEQVINLAVPGENGLTFGQVIYNSFLQTTGKFGAPVRATAAPWTITVPFIRASDGVTVFTYTTTFTDGNFNKTLSRSYTATNEPAP